jgi:hypothetical protein
MPLSYLIFMLTLIFRALRRRKGANLTRLSRGTTKRLSEKTRQAAPGGGLFLGIRLGKIRGLTGQPRSQSYQNSNSIFQFIFVSERAHCARLADNVN